MDRAQDREALIGEIAQERHDGPRALRIKTGGRLVEEKEELGLSSEFHTDSGTLLVLDAQRADRGISVGSQTTHFQTFFDAGWCCQHDKFLHNGDDVLGFLLSEGD